MASRKAVRLSCEITRVLVNHFLLGSTLACGMSLDWYCAALVIFPSAFLVGPGSLRIFRALTLLDELYGRVSLAKPSARRGVLPNIPVEVLALGSHVGQPPGGLAIATPPVLLLLKSTHIGQRVVVIMAWGKRKKLGGDEGRQQEKRLRWGRYNYFCSFFFRGVAARLCNPSSLG